MAWLLEEGVISVQEVNADGCEGEEVSLIVTGVASSISEATVDFTAFPNPANDVVIVTTHGFEAHAFQVLDAAGRVVISERLVAGRNVIDVAPPCQRHVSHGSRPGKRSCGEAIGDRPLRNPIRENSIEILTITKTKKGLARKVGLFFGKPFCMDSRSILIPILVNNPMAEQYQGIYVCIHDLVTHRYMGIPIVQSDDELFDKIVLLTIT